MSDTKCQAIDVKAYSLKEGSVAERREAESHLKGCAECRDELARLQFLQASLGGLREEEPPRRIAFVSDKVFESTWWHRFWESGPKVAFASAAMLSTALMVHAYVQPAPLVPQQFPPAQTASVGAEQVQSSIDSAIAKAVTQVRVEVEERQKAKIDELIAATEKKVELERQALAVAADENQLLRKQLKQFVVQTAGLVKD